MDRGDVPQLRREVEPPHRQPNGLGVMLIASAAMFFAVAGSAFVVRARIAGHCCDRSQAPVRVEPAPAPPAALLTPPDETCGEPIYRNHPDGTVAVSFRLCPTSTPAPSAK